MLGIGVDEEIFLRLHEDRYADELFRLTYENRLHLRPWLPWVDGIKSAEDTRKFIQEMVLKLANGIGYGFAVLYRRELVGAIALLVVQEAMETEVGYWLAEKAQGQGVISRATNTLVRFSFQDLGMNRVVIRCASENVKSRAVPERLGFTLEGTLREREVIPGQDRRDQLVYSLLRSEWEASGQKGADEVDPPDFWEARTKTP